MSNVENRVAKEEAKAFVERWREAGPALERVRREELRGMRHEEQAEMIDALLEAGLHRAQAESTSGLVEMQRLFARTEL